MAIEISDLNVLVVEPSSTQQKIIDRELSALGIESIDNVETGADALDAINQYSPDLVLCAYYLADMNGADLLKQIRSNPNTQEILFLLVSSVTDIRELEPVRQAGVVGILPKPFTATDLSRALKATLDHLNPSRLSLESYDLDAIKILLVDDSMLARKHISRTLEGMGLNNITEATNGQEAVEILNQTFFDLIITDYNMPEMDGKELSEYIREQSMQSSVPIIMVTSEHDGSRLSAVQQAGVSAICDKPFEPDSVRQMIENLLEEY